VKEVVGESCLLCGQFVGFIISWVTVITFLEYFCFWVWSRSC